VRRARALEQARSLGKRYIYFWVDGIHVCTKVRNLGGNCLLDLKRRGLSIGPELAIADGALGIWQAVEEVWPQTRGQRCWVHKTANVLSKLPNSQQPKAKRALQEIWMAETKKDALAAFDAFVETWGVRQGGRVPDQGSRRAARLLRLPG